MIIEGAFYKLPELLLGHAFPRRQYEATLVSHLAMAVLLELNARNIPTPQQRIHVESSYPLEKTGPAKRADLYVDLEGVLPSPQLAHYGGKVRNWIEVKFYGGIGRGTGTETSTSNAGDIVQDLLRLCLLVEERPGKIGDRGRYLLIVFNREPGAYLAFGRQRKGEPDREWLHQLVSPGRHRIEISLSGEAPTLIGAVGPGLKESTDSLCLSLEAVTYSFEPTSQPSEFLYWGYLVRIVSFTVRLGPDEVTYNEGEDGHWADEDVATQRRLAERVFRLEELK